MEALEELRSEEEYLRQKELELEARRKELDDLNRQKRENRRIEIEVKKKEIEMETEMLKKKELQKHQLESDNKQENETNNKEITQSASFTSKTDKEDLLSRFEYQSQLMSEYENKKSQFVKTKPKQTSFKKDNDLWSKVVIEKEEHGTDKNNSSEDFTILFLGEKSSGKSSIISKFLEKTEGITASTALEYTYGRRIKRFSTNQAKDIVHTWDLVANINSNSEEDLTVIQNLVDITITPQFIQNTVIALVVDLSKPIALLDKLLIWFEIIRKRVEDCLKLMKNDLNYQTTIEHLKAKSNLLFGDKHPDKYTLF